jgi:hypothetical protein
VGPTDPDDVLARIDRAFSTIRRPEEVGGAALEGLIAQQADLRSLKHFRQDYPEARAALLYRGECRLLRDDVLCIPVEQFLAELSPTATCWGSSVGADGSRHLLNVTSMAPTNMSVP